MVLVTTLIEGVSKYWQTWQQGVVRNEIINYAFCVTNPSRGSNTHVRAHILHEPSLGFDRGSERLDIWEQFLWLILDRSQQQGKAIRCIIMLSLIILTLFLLYYMARP